MGSTSPIGRDNFEGGGILGERTCPTTLPWAVQKWLNRSRCHLGCGLKWVEGSMCYMGAHWRHLTNATDPFVCGGDAALSQITFDHHLLVCIVCVVRDYRKLNIIQLVCCLAVREIWNLQELSGFSTQTPPVQFCRLCEICCLSTLCASWDDAIIQTSLNTV